MRLFCSWLNRKKIGFKNRQMELKTLLIKAIQLAQKASDAILQVYQSDDFNIQSKEDQSPLTQADLSAHQIISKGLKDTQIPILSEEGEIPDYPTRKQWQRFWMIDPLDGTKEFIQKNGEFTVNIALIEDGIPILGVVYVPVYQTVYFGLKGEGSFMGHQVKVSDYPSLIQQCTALPYKRSQVYTVVASRSHLNEATRLYLQELEQEKGTVNIVSKGSSLKLCLVAEGTADEYPRLSPTMEWDIASGHAVALYSGAQICQIDQPEPLIYNKENLLNPNFKVSRTPFI